MRLSHIRPYVRYARTLELTRNSSYPVSIPYDARLFYVIQGEGIITTCGHQIKMKKGSAILINAGTEYMLKTPEEFVTYIAFNFDYINDNCTLSTPVFPATKKSYDPAKLISYVEFNNENEKAQ